MSEQDLDVKPGSSPEAEGEEPKAEAMDVKATPESSAGEEAAQAGDGEKDGESKDSLLDVVRKATEQASGKEEDKSSESPADGSEAPDGSGYDPKPEDQKDDGQDGEEEDPDKAVPFHEHPRWKEVLAERNKAREERDEFRQKAEEVDQIHAFMQSQNLTPEEVAEGYQIMAAIKNDPAAAYERLQQVFKQVSLASGKALPDDLQQKVDDGLVDEDTAYELAQKRAQGSMTQAQLRSQQERMQRESHETQRREIARAVSDWENGVKNRDPEYGKKQKLVERTARALMAERQPGTVQEALDLVQEAYKTVNEDLKQFRPAKPPVNAPLGSGQSSATKKASVAPKSMEEAIRLAVARAN